jgi:hypothetical protein
MNVQLRDITVTARDGRVSHLDQVYIRGSHVRFFIVPDMLRDAYHTPPPHPNDGWKLMQLLGTPPCSGLVPSAVVVLAWREEGQRLIGRGDRGRDVLRFRQIRIEVESLSWTTLGRREELMLNVMLECSKMIGRVINHAAHSSHGTHHKAGRKTVR